MDALPALADDGIFRQRLDVQVFSQSHGAAGFFHGDLHTLILEHLDKHHCGSDDISVGRRAAPVEDEGGDFAPVDSLENKIGVGTHGVSIRSVVVD